VCPVPDERLSFVRGLIGLASASTFSGDEEHETLHSLAERGSGVRVRVRVRS